MGGVREKEITILVTQIRETQMSIKSTLPGTPPSRPDLDLKRAISGPNQVKIGCKSGEGVEVRGIGSAGMALYVPRLDPKIFSGPKKTPKHKDFTKKFHARIHLF